MTQIAPKIFHILCTTMQSMANIPIKNNIYTNKIKETQKISIIIKVFLFVSIICDTSL
jgi:hypothetical protein